MTAYYIKIMTDKRKLLLAVVKESSVPLNASQVFEILPMPMDLATVYRGLEYLEKNDFVESLVFECRERGIERYFFLKKDHHDTFFHCQECHAFLSAGPCPVDPTVKQLEVNMGFRVLEHQLVMKGVCSQCISRGEKNE